MSSYIRYSFAFIISLFVLTILFNNSLSYASSDKINQNNKNNKLAEHNLVEWVYGENTAPVNIIAYMSMSCQACKIMYNSVLPKVVEEYAMKGKVKLQLRFIANEVTSFESEATAFCLSTSKFQTTREKRDPNKAIDILFKSSTQWYHKSNNRQIIKDILSNNGYSKKEIEMCLDDKQIIDQILQSRLYAAKNLQILATPTIIINEQSFQGLRSYEWLKEKIDALIE